MKPVPTRNKRLCPQSQPFPLATISSKPYLGEGSNVFRDWVKPGRCDCVMEAYKKGHWMCIYIYIYRLFLWALVNF